MTRRYVSEREQFGKPLREIPAVGRGLALMRVALIQARAALDFAVQRRDSSGEQVGSLIARVTAAAVASEIATRAHQLHGAIGVTTEYRLHEYTTRLWAWRDAVADEAEWTRELGTLSLAAGESTVWDRFTNPAKIAWLPNIESHVPAVAEQ
jgi:acyl-CoA dehydrogenase